MSNIEQRLTHAHKLISQAGNIVNHQLTKRTFFKGNTAESVKMLEEATAELKSLIGNHKREG